MPIKKIIRGALADKIVLYTCPKIQENCVTSRRIIKDINIPIINPARPSIKYIMLITLCEFLHTHRIRTSYLNLSHLLLLKLF